MDIRLRINAQALILTALLWAPLQAETGKKKEPKWQEKRHSLMPHMGLGTFGFGSLTQQISPEYQCSYYGSEPGGIAAGLQYEYRLGRMKYVGLQAQMVPNTLAMSPEFAAGFLGYVGPVVWEGSSNFLAPSFTYSQTFDLKWIEAVGRINVGGLMLGSRNAMLADYSWYKNAPEEFYSFAPAATQNMVKSFIPIAGLSYGIRFKHLEATLSQQFSMSSALNPLNYNGSSQRMNLRYSSQTIQIGYRWEIGKSKK